MHPSRLLALAGLLVSVGCAAAPPASAAASGAEPAAAATVPDPAVLGLWIIEQARSAPVLDKRVARLEFGADGALTGHGGCNRLSASYTLEGNMLRIGPIGTTRMACSETLMEQEDRVLTALERAARAAVPPHGFLTLWDADGAVLLRASRAEPASR